MENEDMELRKHNESAGPVLFSGGFTDYFSSYSQVQDLWVGIWEWATVSPAHEGYS